MLDANDSRSIAEYVDAHVNPLAAAIKQAQEAAFAEQAEKTKAFLIELNSKTFDKAQSYTTVIIAGAYAGMFAVWSSAKDALSSKGSNAIALCLTLSLTAYVLYEVAAIAIRTFSFVRFRREITAAKSPVDFAAFIKRSNEREAQAGLHFIPAYAVSLLVTLLPALVASGLLIYNTAAKLLDWPRWPA